MEIVSPDDTISFTEDYPPKLVERVRTLIAFSHREPEQYALLHRLGILEGALPPERRPPA